MEESPNPFNSFFFSVFGVFRGWNCRIQGYLATKVFFWRRKMPASARNELFTASVLPEYGAC
jgi:hypothetical protein